MIFKVYNAIQNSLSDQGIAIVTHNTAKVYDSNNDWVSFNTKFDQNKRDYHDQEKNKYTRRDGTPVKKSVLDPEGKVTFTFYDFFYRRKTYKSAFLAANLELIESHKPLGRSADPVTWKSEAKVPPYRIDILRKARTETQTFIKKPSSD